VRGLSAAARRLLQQYDWPGNVRELENAIERAVVLGSTELILPEDLPETLLEVAPAPGLTQPSGYHEALNEKKKELIRAALHEARGSYVEAARLLDLHPNYLHRLIRNLNLKEELRGLGESAAQARD
jgi:Nif-specific regulatory protein